MPFENASKAPGIEWMGEAFPEVLNHRLASAAQFTVRREDRVYAFDRAGIPPAVRPSRPTLFRIAEELDVDFAVVGSYTYDGQTFTARAQLIDVKAMRLLPEVTESGSLLNLLAIANALAWDALRQLHPEVGGTKDAFVAAESAVRLDAFENYVRGVTATEQGEKLRRLREALRLNPQYADAIFQLGKTFFAARDYGNAALWLARVPRADAQAGDAAFHEGLAHYYLAEYDKAETAFAELAQRTPLTEVYNNEGVVAGRRGKRSAADLFQKAVAADPGDPDYRYNLAVALARAGDTAGAQRQLRETLTLRANDIEARQLLEAIQRGDQSKPALERIKRNYDEQSFRQLELEIRNVSEARLAQSDPATHALFHVEHARQLLTQGFALDAEKEFREAVVLDPANPAAHAGLGASLEARDAVAARSEATAALRLQPLVEAYLVLGRLELRDNKLEAAARNADAALALEPLNAAAQGLKRDIAARQRAPR